MELVLVVSVEMAVMAAGRGVGVAAAVVLQSVVTVWRILVHAKMLGLGTPRVTIPHPIDDLQPGLLLTQGLIPTAPSQPPLAITSTAALMGGGAGAEALLVPTSRRRFGQWV